MRVFLKWRKNKMTNQSNHYTLIQVCEREITTTHFSTKFEAYQAMKLQFEEVASFNPLDETEIRVFGKSRGDSWEFDEGDCEGNSSWISFTDNKYDWKIIENSFENEENGMMLDFGTAEVGRSCMKLQFTNDWLTLKISVTADKGTTFIECYDADAFKHIGVIEEEHTDTINDISYESLEAFNASIYQVLLSYFTNYFDVEEYAEGRLDGFQMTGLVLDLD